MARLLIVEDEFLIARVLQRMVRSMGHEVCALASTGVDAVTHASQERPDLILMDIRLAGEMTGIDAARQILRHHPTPIIFVSGYSNEEIKQEAMSLSPVAFLPKPVSRQRLQPVIAAALGD